MAERTKTIKFELIPADLRFVIRALSFLQQKAEEADKSDFQARADVALAKILIADLQGLLQ